MIFRVLITVVLTTCMAQSAMAGVITENSLDFEFDSATSMSIPDESPVDSPLNYDGTKISNLAEFGMSTTTSTSTITTHAAVQNWEFDFSVIPTLVGSRWRLRNETLPPSPYAEGLLKPS